MVFCFLPNNMNNNPLRNENTPKYFLQRAWIYSKEMFPVFIYIPYVVALYFCVNIVIQILNSPAFIAAKTACWGEGTTQQMLDALHAAGAQVVFDSTSFAGVVSAFFVMLMMRTFDDLKDFELDAHLFPHRATAQKLVLKRDIQAISLTSFLTLIVVNLIWGQPTLAVFAIMMTYTVLTFKWFFAEKFHREHIFFTMLDHQPLPYVINFFLIHTALASGAEYESFQTIHFILLLIVSMPITAWEISRKIRSADMETEYETFSMVIGRKPATIIPMLFLLTVCALHLHVGTLLAFGPLFQYIVYGIAAVVLFFYLRFLIKPSKENNVLTNVSLFATTTSFLNLLFNTLIVYNIL
jgi:4-hydroxybenzoate polyprenyltransferase